VSIGPIQFENSKSRCPFLVDCVAKNEMYPNFEAKKVEVLLYSNINPKINLSQLNRCLIEDQRSDFPNYLLSDNYYCFKVNHLPVNKQSKSYYKNDKKLHPLLFNSRYLEFIP